MKNNLRARQYVLTINPNAKCYSKDKNTIKDVVSKNFGCTYSFIYHNKEQDTNNNNHIHLVLKFEQPKAFSTIQKVFEGSHIEVCKDYKKAIQYLVHENDKEKTPYELEDITSSLSKAQLEELFSQDEQDVLDEETLFECIDKGYSLRDFVKRFGLFRVNLYKNLIKDLIAEKHNQDAYDIREHINQLNKQLQNAYAMLDAFGKTDDYQ